MSSLPQTSVVLQPGFEPDADSCDWTFTGASTRELTHCYHDYPARMIPQVARKLLDTFAPDATLLFDPYCGTGTSLVEGMARGINVVGTDLNPLARLIAQSKTRLPCKFELDNQFSRFAEFISEPCSRLETIAVMPGISRVDFWFKPTVTRELFRLKFFIGEIEDEDARLFFQVAFSETVRECSNTRNEEFKLYRYEAAKLEKFNPEVFGIMSRKLARNLTGLEGFRLLMSKLGKMPQVSICDFDTVRDIPSGKVTPARVDIVITSPPYGDSHTTVAYGQYSRLSAAWLGLREPDKVDRKLMGGQVRKDVPSLPCDALRYALAAIRESDTKRASEVATFYFDLYHSISHVSQTLKAGGYACYVVGNRKVKGVTLPTDVAVRCFFEQHGFDYVETFHRTIPNKRMPLRNSPTNAVGKVENTMSQEHIVVMRRRKQ